MTSDVERETNALSANLARKNEDLRRLERDHEQGLERLRELNNLMDSLRS